MRGSDASLLPPFGFEEPLGLPDPDDTCDDS
jgi:hypothetical protein